MFARRPDGSLDFAAGWFDIRGSFCEAAVEKLSSTFAAWRRGAILILALWLSLVPAAAQAQLGAEPARHEASALIPALEAIAHAAATLPEAATAVQDRGKEPGGGGDLPLVLEFAHSAPEPGLLRNPRSLPPATAPPSAPTFAANQARAPPQT
jgi:hypothetical protein